MKRIIATVAAGILLCVSGAARADRSHGSRPHGRARILIGMDTEFGIPLGNYADVNSVGGGALVVGEYPMMDMLSMTARVGFQAHVDRTVNGLGSHVHAIPVLLGTKYYGAGVGYQEDRWNARVSIHTQDVGNFGNAFTITGGIGYQFSAL